MYARGVCSIFEQLRYVSEKSTKSKSITTNKRANAELCRPTMRGPSQRNSFATTSHTNYGAKNVEVYIILNFLAFDKPQHNTNYDDYDDVDADDDDDVRSPITSLLPTNISKDERIATREKSLHFQLAT